jgi:hypothetical protein
MWGYKRSPNFDAAPNASTDTIPSYAEATNNSPQLASNTNTGAWFKDRPKYTASDNYVYEVEACAICENSTTTPPTYLILGCVKFKWDDEIGNAKLTLLPTQLILAEKPAAGFPGVGKSLDQITPEKPSGVFLPAMKAWNPNWGAP